MHHGRTQGSKGQEITWSLSLPRREGPHPLVIMVHGFKGFKDWGFFPLLAERFANAGIAALRINTSHNGVGLDDDQDKFTRLELFAQNRTSYEVADVQTMIQLVRSGAIAPFQDIDTQRLGLWGHSRGGAAVLLAAAHSQDIQAVVTWCSVATVAFPDPANEAFQEYKVWEFKNGRTGQDMWLNIEAYEDVTPLPPALDLKARMKEISAQTLLIHGKSDSSVPLQSVFDLSEASAGKAEIYLVDEADHVMNCRHPFDGPTPAFESATLRTLIHLTTIFHV